MKKSKTEVGQPSLDQQRREFVKKSTLVGVGVVASAALPGAAVASTSDQPVAESKQQKGYQLTQHVIEYYKSAAS